MLLKGKDDDQSGTINAEISYTIVSQEPEGTGHMFTLEEKTGKLFVKEPTLDREVMLFLTVHTIRHMYALGRIGLEQTCIVDAIQFIKNINEVWSHPTDHNTFITVQLSFKYGVLRELE